MADLKTTAGNGDKDVSEIAKQEAIDSALIDLAVEAWKFTRLFNRVISKLDPVEQARYVNQVRFFQRRIDSAADSAGVRIVSIEGQPFEPGMAATPLNLEDFGPEEALFVEQMLEPIVMGADGVRRTGAMMLRRL